MFACKKPSGQTVREIFSFCLMSTTGIQTAPSALIMTKIIKVSFLQALPEFDIDAVHDFELHHTRRPKVLVQTAGHVAGAARYYQRKDVKNDPWDKKKVCNLMSMWDVQCYILFHESCRNSLGVHNPLKPLFCMAESEIKLMKTEASTRYHKK